jgi:acyl-CoA synthetase (AMP-forming)/AMP-acid ligase II
MAGTGETVTYAELDRRSNQVANLLRQRGLRRGDSIAIFMENNARFLEVAWGAARSGLYYTAVSSRLTAPEVSYIVNDCGAKALFTSRERAEVATEAVKDTPNASTRVMFYGSVDGFDDAEDVLGSQSEGPIEDESLGMDMLYSSGTTGRPKGVKLPLPDGPIGSPTGVFMLATALYGATSDTVYLSPAPLYHAAPLRFSMAMQQAGATVVVMEHFDPVEFLRCVQDYKVTHTQVVPTMFVRLLKLPKDEREKFDTSSLRTVIHAAAPCPIPVKQEMIEWWGPIIHEYYAGTEGNGFTAINSDEWMAHKGSVGKPLVGTIHIVGEDGEELPTGEAGTIYFESASAFEYHNDPEKTASSRHPKGWSTLGDVAVFGIPNDEMGEEVKAVVQPMNMSEAGPELERELIAFCKSQLASYKCPRSIDFEAELPRHPTGKLYKRLLRDRYWGGHESRIV